MNSLEILRALALIPDHTIGVYPSDMIPETWQIPAALVFNTDNSKKPGTHWVAAYVDRKSSGYYFDSYGIKPYIPDHVMRLRKNCKTLRYNDHQLQSVSSDVCGHFCVMFLYYMACGLGFREFLKLFTLDLHKNDLVVEEFVDELVASKVTSRARKSDVLNGSGLCSQTCCAQKKIFCLNQLKKLVYNKSISSNF